MLTVREVGREDQAAATAVGENYQHSSKEPGREKKQSSSRPDQDNRDVTPWINYHFHLCYIYLFLHHYISTPPHHSFRFPSKTEHWDVHFNLKGKAKRKTQRD